MMAPPPNWRMPTSKEMRVRVECLSKIIASTRPASGASGIDARLSADLCAPPCGGALRRSALCSVAPSRSAMSRKCFGPTAVRRGRVHAATVFLSASKSRAASLKMRHRFAHMRFVDDQRRQQTHDIVARADRQHAVRAQARRRTRCSALSSSGPASGLRRAILRTRRDVRRSAAPVAGGNNCAILRTCSRKPGASTMSSTLLPTAMPSGLPPKVVPCVPAVMPFAASAVARHAPIG